MFILSNRWNWYFSAQNEFVFLVMLKICAFTIKVLTETHFHKGQKEGIMHIQKQPMYV